MARKKSSLYNPDTDGEDHINIWTKGKTVLGKKLSHFHHSPFIHPYYGSFQCVEGFWYYASTGFQHEQLRQLVGFKAKQEGRQLDQVWYKDFVEDVLSANWQKIMQSNDLCSMIIESELPFLHYYAYSGNPDSETPGPVKIIRPRDSVWLVPGFEDIRRCLKEGKVPEFWSKAMERYATNVASGRPAHKSKTR